MSSPRSLESESTSEASSNQSADTAGIEQALDKQDQDDLQSFETPSQKISWLVFLMIVIIVTTWATPNVVGKYLADFSQLSPTQISALRYLPAGITLLLFSLLLRKGKLLIADIREHPFHIVVSSVILASFVLFQMYSVVYTTASASSFLLNVNPVFTFVMAIILLKEKRRWWGYLGTLMSAAGIFFVAVPFEEITTLFSSQLLLGNTLALLSGVAWAAYSIYLKKFLDHRDPITVTTWTLVLSSIILTIVMFIVDGWFTFTPKALSLVLTTFLGVVPTAISFTLWLAAIKRAPVQKVSVFQFLIPIIATLFAMVLLGETIDYFFGIGGGLIVVGLIITQLS